MPRDHRAHENQKRARAWRDNALKRAELGQPTAARTSATGATSFAVKVDDAADRKLIEDALAKRDRQ